jgi:hypothetical protein
LKFVKRLQKNLKKVLLETKKGCMFAAAKNGNGFSKISDKLDCFEKV